MHRQAVSGLRALLNIAVLAAAALGASRCVKEFDPPSKLGDHIQVLAVKASPPEIRPTESVDLAALVYVPDNWPYPLDALWLTCLPDVGESTQACLETVFAQLGEPMHSCELSCANDPDPPDCVQACLLDEMLNFLCTPNEVQKGCIAGYGGRVDYHLPPGSFPDDGERHTFYVFLLATALPNGLGDCFNVWADQIAASSPMGPTQDCTLSLKRVTVIPEDEERADNPGLQSLYALNVAVPPPPDGLQVELAEPDPKDNKLDLEVTLDATTVQSDETVSVYLSWFTDCGSVDKSRTFGDQLENTLKPDRTGACRVYVVVRDGNTGVGWLERRLDLVAASTPP